MYYIYFCDHKLNQENLFFPICSFPKLAFSVSHDPSGTPSSPLFVLAHRQRSPLLDVSISGDAGREIKGIQLIVNVTAGAQLIKAARFYIHEQALFFSSFLYIYLRNDFIVGKQA